MNTIVGFSMLFLAGVLFFRYRPKFQSSRALCALTGAMGFMALTVGSGGLWFQLLQAALSAVVAVCCVQQLRREKRVRARRAARMRAHRPSGELPRAQKSCA